MGVACEKRYHDINVARSEAIGQLRKRLEDADEVVSEEEIKERGRIAGEEIFLQCPGPTDHRGVAETIRDKEQKDAARVRRDEDDRKRYAEDFANKMDLAQQDAESTAHTEIKKLITEDVRATPYYQDIVDDIEEARKIYIEARQKLAVALLDSEVAERAYNNTEKYVNADHACFRGSPLSNIDGCKDVRKRKIKERKEETQKALSKANNDLVEAREQNDEAWGSFRGLLMQANIVSHFTSDSLSNNREGSSGIREDSDTQHQYPYEYVDDSWVDDLYLSERLPPKEDWNIAHDFDFTARVLMSEEEETETSGNTGHHDGLCFTQ